MSLFYQFTVPQFTNMLTNLEKFFDKAHTYATAKKFDENVLLESRLAPDMYPLVKQIQIATDMIKGCVARLAGQEPPKFEDNEKNVDELRERIRKTLTYIRGVKQEDFKGCEDRRVTLPWAPGKYMHGGEYVIQMAMPNIYFHISMTYAILRHNGVDVGKSDFIGSPNMKDA